VRGEDAKNNHNGGVDQEPVRIPVIDAVPPHVRNHVGRPAHYLARPVQLFPAHNSCLRFAGSYGRGRSEINKHIGNQYIIRAPPPIQCRIQVNTIPKIPPFLQNLPRKIHQRENTGMKGETVVSRQSQVVSGIGEESFVRSDKVCDEEEAVSRRRQRLLPDPLTTYDWRLTTSKWLTSLKRFTVNMVPV
jgi:hypothetical protein